MTDPQGGWEQERRSPPKSTQFVRLVMGALFYCVLTPVGLLLRLAGRDRLRLRFDRAAPSYWIARSPANGRRTAMTRQF